MRCRREAVFEALQAHLRAADVKLMFFSPSGMAFAEQANAPFPLEHAPTLAAVPLNPPQPLPQVFVLASVQVYMTQTGTLALATLPFLSRGSVLIDLGMPTGARPTFYAAEYVYATFDHVQVCGCTHPSSLRHALSQHGATAACAFAFLLTRQEHETAEPVRWSGQAGRQAGRTSMPR